MKNAVVIVAPGIWWQVPVNGQFVLKVDVLKAEKWAYICANWTTGEL